MSLVLDLDASHGPERIQAGLALPDAPPVTSQCYRLGDVLVDAGPPNRITELLGALDGRAITHVLLTHQHEDHVGLAAPLAERGAVVHAPAQALAALAAPVPIPPYRERVWGVPRPVDAVAYEGDRVVAGDHVFEVVPAPGHSHDHVVLHEADEGWVFTGDAALGVRPELRFDEDLPTSLETLSRIRELEARVLFPGHGAVVEDPGRFLGGTLAGYERLHRDAWRLRRKGAPVPTIAEELLGPEGHLTRFSEGEFSKAHLVEALLRMGP